VNPMKNPLPNSQIPQSPTLQRDSYNAWVIHTTNFDYPLNPCPWLALAALWIAWLYRWTNPPKPADPRFEETQ